MSEQAFATGHCLCGDVQYSISTKPSRMAQCHCDHCQRSTGTGHMSLAFFNKDDVVIEGKTNSFTTTADSGAEVTRHFCPNCGSRLFGTNNVLTTMISVSVGCIDDHSWFKPQVVVYHKSKAEWDFIDEELPKFPEMPPLPK